MSKTSSRILLCLLGFLLGWFIGDLMWPHKAHPEEGPTFTDPFSKDEKGNVVQVKITPVLKTFNPSEAETLKGVEVHHMYFDSFYHVLYLSVHNRSQNRANARWIMTFAVVDGKTSIGALYTTLYNGDKDDGTDIFICLPRIPKTWRDTLAITADQVHLQ